MAAQRSPKASVGVRVPSRPHFMQYTDENIYKVGSTYARHALKRRLIKNGTIPYVCTGCGNKGEWLGKPMALQLDHINGVSNDNRLLNLRFICPNCHSQTETYVGKNSKGTRCKEKVKPNFRAEKLKRDRLKLEQALSTGSIKIGEWGWKGQLADAVGVSNQKIIKWLLRVDPVFLIEHNIRH